MKTLRRMGWIAFVGVVLIAVLWEVTIADVEKDQSRETQSSAAIEKAVMKVHDELIAAAENRDAETMFGYILENDKGAIIQDGQLMSRQEALQQIRQAFERVSAVKYDFKQRQVKVLSPEIALMTATGTTTTTIPTGETFSSTFANTSVFVLSQDGWKIIHGHHSIPNDN